MCKKVAIVLAGFCLGMFATAQVDSKLEQAAIAKVKSTLVSQLHPGMPKVTLEYYLQTQSGKDAKIKWEMNDCGEATGDPADRNIADPPTCVEADVTNAHGDTAVLFVAVGSVKTGVKGKPKVFSISFKDAQGNTKELRRIGQIPLEFENASGS